MTDWTTLEVADNFWYASSGAPLFSLKHAGLDSSSIVECKAKYLTVTGRTDSSIVGEPLFAETTLYSIAKGSPAVDKVECLASTDFDGTARPRGACCDTGAHEFEQ
jgi:hypothetical protein